VKPYEYRHIVALEETNVVGNVYYANHVRWQGRCREMFLKDHAKSVVQEFARGLYLVTTRVSCEYFDELRAFDEVLIRMYAREVMSGRVTMAFEYFRVSPGPEQLVARGEQQIASMRQQGSGAVAVPLPTELADALAQFR
jgi:enediyne core biosynthesis thioesterase